MSDLNKDHQESKICSKCKIEKLLVEFNADSRCRDGKRASCKVCDSILKKQIRERNIDKYRSKNAENNRKYYHRRKKKNIDLKI